MKKPLRNKPNFFVILGTFVFFLGLLVALMSPQIASWRWSVVDRLLVQAKQSNNANEQYGYLQQALLIDSHDPQAVEAMAQFWISRGEVSKAISVYVNGISEPNYVALGNLALRAQDYTLAQKYFERASKEGKTSASLVGEANTFYNLGQISEGCNKAVDATKLSLENTTAKMAVMSCVVLGGTSDEAGSLKLEAGGGQIDKNSREAAYFLITNQVYKPGEKILQDTKDKAEGDWLSLARLAAARGELQDAIAKAEQGIALNRSDMELSRELVGLYTLSNNPGKAQEYTARLQQLEFAKYR